MDSPQSCRTNANAIYPARQGVQTSDALSIQVTQTCPGSAWIMASTSPAWLAAAPAAELQPFCDTEGFNLHNDYNKVRIGIVANNEELECDTHDSRLGVGGGGCDDCRHCDAAFLPGGAGRLANPPLHRCGGPGRGRATPSIPSGRWYRRCAG